MSASDTVSGQFLLSQSTTPDRPDLAAEWDGRDLSGHAARLTYAHGDAAWDWYLSYWDYANGFRADTGFVPQVGTREGYGEAGRTWRPEGGPIRRVRAFVFSDYTADRDDGLVFRGVSPGFVFDGRWNSFVRLRWAADRVRTGDRVLSTDKLYFTVQASPTRAVARLSLDGNVGEQVDFANHRLGDGGTVTLDATLRPGAHTEIVLSAGRRWLDVDEAARDGENGPVAAARGRLFTADLARLRAQYSFSARSYLRLITDWVETRRDPSLYVDAVDAHRRRPHRLAPLRLQAQLADGPLRRLRRPAPARTPRRRRHPRARQPTGLPQALLRLPEIGRADRFPSCDRAPLRRFRGTIRPTDGGRGALPRRGAARRSRAAGAGARRSRRTSSGRGRRWKHAAVGAGSRSQE